MTTKLAQLRAQLAEAAGELEGHAGRWLRRADACRILDCHPMSLQARAKRGDMHCLVIQVPRDWRNSHGVQIYYRLDQLQWFARHRWINRPITERERQIIRQMAGLHSIEAIAKASGRPAASVKCVIQREGGIYHLLREEHGLLLVSAFARLVRRHRSAVQTWIDHGMPTFRRPVKRSQHLIHLPTVRLWLAHQDNILLHMGRGTRELLRLTVADVEAIRSGEGKAVAA